MGQGIRCFSRFHLRQLVFLVFFWFCICFIVFHVRNNQAGLGYIGSHIGSRELLQQGIGSLDYFIGRRASGGKIKESPKSDLTEKRLLNMFEKASNLPAGYWSRTRAYPSKNDSCSKFPSLYDLDFNNVYWQRLQTSNASYYFFGAYYDDRPRVGKIPLVRVLTMVDKIKPEPVYCQLWYDTLINGSHHYFTEASYTYIWHNKWGNYADGILQPFLISCPVPESVTNVVPASVSLIQQRCDKPKNNIRVVNNRPQQKQDFAVCVKGLDFLYQDISIRLVEWIELLHILGAKKIFLYELEVHPNVSKVISYYVKRGLVELTPITLPGSQPNLPGFRHLYLKSKVVNKRQNELIPYNDCLYKNLYSYDYLVLLDTDEVIMPLKHASWKELIEEVVGLALKMHNYTRASYNFMNVYFLDDVLEGEDAVHEAHEEGIPPYLHMLQHVYRSVNYTKPGFFVKCFHNVDRVVSLHNHFPLNCFGQCTTYSVNSSIAHMQHYRKDCVGFLQKVCKDFRTYTTRDTAIWRFKDELIQRSTKALADLNFFHDGVKYS